MTEYTITSVATQPDFSERTSEENRTHAFFASFGKVTCGMTLEEKGAYATLAACIVATTDPIADDVAVRILNTTLRKWKRLKESLLLSGAITMNAQDGSVMVKALKNRLYKSGYAYIKTPISSKLRWEVFQRDGYQCLRCDAKTDLTADHILAEIDGGETVLDNLQTLCRVCNSRKGAK